ncbi:hypothetical protein MCUN1_000500 [Malassezia cuniculi]|uniref:Septation initiation network scaffold protein cdc11 n=1 Tax=Malassezia cuniculi TaxID=948313 RepID=A0AAF0J4Q9_9BASI|nr:hypothetical protein MCUN1_000500 [Malassezia cuniculi]
MSASAGMQSGSVGTVIQRSDVSSLPPILQPAWKAAPARGGNRLLAIGGDMFSPMKLQQMFLTPSGASLSENAPSSTPASKPSSAREQTRDTVRDTAPDASQVPADEESAHLPSAEFTFRAAAHPTSSSTPVARRGSGPPSTPGGPHVPLRLFNVRYDDRVRSGLEQLVEERAEPSLDDSLSLQNMRESKRLRMGSHGESPKDAPAAKRIPLTYRSTNTPDKPPVRKSTTPGVAPRAMGTGVHRVQQQDENMPPPQAAPTALAATPRRPSAPREAPRSILKGGNTHTGTRIMSSRSISFAEPPPLRAPSMTPRTARLEQVLSDLERLNVTYSHVNDDESEVSHAQTDHSTTRAATEASFRITRDKLVEILTDVAPWEPDWATLRHVDLRARHVESVIGLAELLPQLESVWLDHNQLSFTTGLPSGIRVLTVSSNKMTELASFDHLRNLQVLDVSSNELQSLQALQPLAHLREIWADNNKISSLAGIERLSSLEKLSLSHNSLSGRLDLARVHWPELSELRVGGNSIEALEGLGAVSTLTLLDADNNSLSELVLPTSLRRLLVLRVSDNEGLHELDVSAARALHTIYADRCSLRQIHGLECTSVRRLSLRQQGVRFAAPLPPLDSLERLFLSGNALTDAHIFSAPSLRLAYLELSGCQLTALPHTLVRDVPNVRTLNIDHNHVTELPSQLSTLRRLKRLSLVGCRIPRLENVTRAVHGLNSLHVLDTRTNPCTLGLYPPMLIPAEALSSESDVQYLPPVPHPDVVQPDAEAAAHAAHEAEYQAARALADRSQFHKRAMLLPKDPAAPPPLEPAHTHAAALFKAADRRFSATLPHHLAVQRRLYRGVCGMACPALTWLDGLELSDAEVSAAAAHVRHL